jgi:hypothetical protein
VEHGSRARGLRPVPLAREVLAAVSARSPWCPRQQEPAVADSRRPREAACAGPASAGRVSDVGGAGGVRRRRVLGVGGGDAEALLGAILLVVDEDPDLAGPGPLLRLKPVPVPHPCHSRRPVLSPVPMYPLPSILYLRAMYALCTLSPRAVARAFSLHRAHTRIERRIHLRRVNRGPSSAQLRRRQAWASPQAHEDVSARRDPQLRRLE